MIRPICIKPAIAKPIAFSGTTEIETTTGAFGPKTTAAVDFQKITAILNLTKNDICGAYPFQNGNDSGHTIVLKGKDDVKINAKGDWFIGTETINHREHTPTSLTEKTSRWYVNTTNTIFENPEIEAAIKANVKKACEHVRKLVKEYHAKPWWRFLF